ncbi:MAG TPA: AraC family transcriptional regulator [Aquabacterium sp.]|uniref:AraC family transcriptional regulator n=1 Tax=Aquabacterium sp. TaxID=1872578 RepID=UPI002E314471|nr:AraC family transcriptional regulator [Aquabacterium sp.]HEX5373631.1 AraC family transcriptional regulator [Aquabacterium sp.]
MDQHATTLATWVRVICRALEAEHVPSAPLLARAGLAEVNFDDLSVRVPVRSVGTLWRLSVDATGDDAFGVKAARHSWITTFHALGYALIASPSLHDAFQRVERYFRVITDAVIVHYTVDGDECRVTLAPPVCGPQSEPEAIDASAMVLVRLVRTMVGDRQMSPVRVDFQRPAPQNTDTFVRAFRCPLRFGAPHTCIVWSRELMERPLEAANPQLLEQQEHILAKLVEQLDRDNLSTQVKRMLANMLPQGEPSQDQIAQHLGMSARTLQRRLADLDTTYTDVLDSTRHELALSYLNDRQCSLKEVAFLLGFSDTGNFTRAFKRWTGITPSDHRRPHKQAS